MRFIRLFFRSIIDLPQTLPSFRIFQFIENLFRSIISLHMMVVRHGISTWCGDWMYLRWIESERILIGSWTHLKKQHQGQSSRVPDQNDSNVHSCTFVIVRRSSSFTDVRGCLIGEVRGQWHFLESDSARDIEARSRRMSTHSGYSWSLH